MGLLARALVRSIENPATKLTDPAQWFIDWVSGGPSKAGISVTHESAIRLTALWRGIRLVSDMMASLPVFVYQRQDPRGRTRLLDHPVTQLLHYEPNPHHTAFFFREFLQGSLMLRGNAYAAIRRDGAGRARELWPLLPQRVEPAIDEQTLELFYLIRLSNGQKERWERENILHVPGLSFDGLKGMSVLGAARDAIGAGLAVQDYAATLFARGGRVPGVLEYQGSKLSPEAQKNIQSSWDANVGGVDNWHKIAVLDRGLSYKSIGIPPDEAQFLESRKFTVLEIARMLGVNPHKLYDLERATFSNIEHQAIEFVTDTLLPYGVRWEQELSRKLLTREERGRLFIEFSLQGLLRGDSKARADFYALGRQWGWLSANDVLDKENEPDIGDQGDIYLIPENMRDASEGPRPPVDAPPEGSRCGHKGSALRRRLRATYRSPFEDLSRRLLNRESSAIEKALRRALAGGTSSRRGLRDFRTWLEDFYRDNAAFVARNAQPLLQGYGEAIAAAAADEIRHEPEGSTALIDRLVADYAQAVGVRETQESLRQVREVLKEAGEQDVPPSILGLMATWTRDRPPALALRETVKAAGAVAREIFRAGGRGVRWSAEADACDACRNLHGKVSDAQGVFRGQPSLPEDAAAVGHPPLHAGCTCDVEPL